jgi:hypothetical protein
MAPKAPSRRTGRASKRTPKAAANDPQTDSSASRSRTRAQVDSSTSRSRTRAQTRSGQTPRVSPYPSRHTSPQPAVTVLPPTYVAPILPSAPETTSTEYLAPSQPLAPPPALQTSEIDFLRRIADLEAVVQRLAPQPTPPGASYLPPHNPVGLSLPYHAVAPVAHPFG